jgi:hypothetical protein
VNGYRYGICSLLIEYRSAPTSMESLTVSQQSTMSKVITTPSAEAHVAKHLTSCLIGKVDLSLCSHPCLSDLMSCAFVG